MTDNIDVKIRNIKNTFLPTLKTKLLSINDIISLLKKGMCCPLEELPDEVRKKVQVVIEQRTVRKNSISKDTSEEMK